MGMGVASWCFEWAVCAGGDVGELPMCHFGFQAAIIAPAFRQPEISAKLKTDGAQVDP